MTAPVPGSSPQHTLFGELTVLDDVGPPRRNRAYPAGATPLLLLLPAGVLLGALVLWPVVRILIASVTDGDQGFVGLRHFSTALEAEGAWAVVGRTVLWAVVVPTVVTALGYALAVISWRSRTGRFTRLVMVAPVAVPLVVTGVVFRLLYDPEPRRGLATALAGALPFEVPALLGPSMITASLMSAFVWAWVGLAVMVFRAALAAVPADLGDAVRAHGGTRWDVFRDAQWQPLLRRTTAVVFALVALGTARSFDLILMMAPGSVVDDASVLALRVWQTTGGEVTGPGAALGVVWLVVVALGVVVAALGTRQACPPPRAEAPPPVEADLLPRPAPGPGRGLRVARRGVLTLAAVVWLLPLVGLAATALHAPWDAATRGWWAAPVSLDSYQLLSSELTRSLVFTLVLATVVTAVVLVLAMLAAYALAWISGPAAHAAGVVLLAAAVVPIQVIAGPVNEVLGVTRVAGSGPGLGMVHIALGLPFAVLVLRNALADLPARTVQSARLAAGGRAGTIWLLARSVVPAIVAVCVLEAVQVWNDLVVGLLFSGPDGTPVGLLLYGQSRNFVAGSGPLAASSVIASLLPVVLVVLARRQIVTGLVSGAIR